MDLGLADRTFIVTGASRGLGRATAEQLVSEGANVVLSSRDAEQLADTVAQLGDSALGVPGDNADSQLADQLVTAAKERFGQVNGCLVSVGGPPAGSLMETTDAQWRTAFESVFLGAVRMARTVADAIEGPGSIALVLSTSVVQPIGGLAISNGLRPGLAMVAKTLADELGPRQIRVNGLLPGRIDTDRVRELDSLAPDPTAARSGHEVQIPLRRYGTPEEFGKVAAFLLSDAANYVTGTMVPVDGGLSRGL